VVVRRGRWKTVCAAVARQALLGGRSTSPLGISQSRMMRTMLLSSLLGLVACSSAHADDQAFTNFIAAMKKHTNRLPSPVSVSAVGAVEGRELVLRFAVTNRLKKTLTLYPFELPWGGTYAINWAAVTGDGHVLEVGYPFDDRFAPEEKVALTPGQTVTGNYHLSWMLDPARVPANTDIVIVWLYSFPAGPLEGKDQRPICTGVAYIHTP